ncbi:uncharacterized protein BDCG_02109 [Blastomyces dermatitidis ER-3]|uniref:Regulator of phospholipase D SRF1 n=3 Tax=Blastomyces TaxID=229219 RepID=A0A179UKJ4_BLAGS|nr:uncharacterized protein BDBG_03783 [Blastomyces gilchristii SLH14081]XP_045274410.1 uncharacterized protein BDCG_02109 [Blastomyces dermatitidis ER-3]EEQ86989.1 hypothetical protein BDCG_02109 [Blastomyces dermatitidis ER-3]EGE79782.1 hypothetical protein BDDG_02723 [Blastomyces dermatitidis ATCC 18188]OAT07748.1 hypothetical protein BDBG_03783 [Blastomyces gilchristii SLH14081]
MAIYGDTHLRPQPPDAQSGVSPRRKSELSLVDHPLVRQKSGTSVARSSVNGDEVRSGFRCSHDKGSIRPTSRAPSKGASIGTQSNNPLPSARTIPAWVRVHDETTGLPPPSHSVPPEPSGARIAQHHYAPHEKQRDSYTSYDSSGAAPRESRWKTFAKTSAYPRSSTDLEQKLVDHDWLQRNLGDYSTPWQGHNTNEKDLESGGQPSLDFRQRKVKFFSKIQSKLLRSPIVPLLIRLTVFIFSVVALALGGSIRYYATKYNHSQGPSSDMAIIVDSIALVYLVYITYDEYTGKPLGLRPAKAKLRLLFLDLIFIVFASANLSLAFESLSDIQSACRAGEVDGIFDPRNGLLCDRQKTLASVLLVVLIAWLTTFAISVLRVVERVTGK